MKEKLNKCSLCPRACKVNRTIEKGFCGIQDKMIVARASLHDWEEPCLSGTNGSGTIFFTGCNLRCVFCQNDQISTNLVGQEITIEQFSEICLALQKQGAHNINLVTPTIYIPLLVEGLTLAKSKGLEIPIVYNTSSYETPQALKLLDGLIDIYLPDLKYYDDTYAIRYSQAPHYFHYAQQAIHEMYRQVGNPVFDSTGILLKGVIVRHLMLPGLIEDTKQILAYLFTTYHHSIYISIMNQYTPVHSFKRYPELNQTISEKDYDEVINYALDLGIKNAFIQEGDTAIESFIPDFLNQELPF